MAKEFGELNRKMRTRAVIGILLIVCGLIGLLNSYANVDWWTAAVEGGQYASGAIAPILIICLGVYIVWAIRHGRFYVDERKSESNELALSRTDRRIAGVCGGIAQYFGIDSTLTRVVTLVLFLIAPLFTMVVYVVIAIVLRKS